MPSDQSNYTIEERVITAVWFHEKELDCFSIEEIRHKFIDRFDRAPPALSTMQSWSRKLFETGNILDLPRSGRPDTRHNVSDDVFDSVVLDPKLSTRKRSHSLAIPRTTLRRVLKKDLGLHPYKPLRVQFLSHVDYEARVDCCTHILDTIPLLRDRMNVFFSDECAVYSDAHAKNVVWWSRENPHFYQQVQQHPPSVMIWCAISGRHLIGPYFIDDHVNAQSYLRLLQNEFIPRLGDLGLLNTAYFMQDGAPPHTARIIRNYLNETLPGRWIGMHGPLS